MIIDYKNFTPIIDSTCFIAQGAVITGNVKVGENSSVWFNAVLRGDIAKIIIGKNTNIQDGCIVHCVIDVETIVGDNVTVGHGAILHSCTIGDGTLVGMGAIVLDGAKIGKNCLVAAGSIVTPNTVIENGVLVMGSPAKIKRKLTEDDLENIKKGTLEYMVISENYSKY